MTMKVLPTQNGDAAAPRVADTRVENADRSAFKTVLAQASTGAATAPGTDVATDDPAAVSLRKGEKMEAVKDHKYAEITAGARAGMFINTSGNVRNGEAFVLVRKNGKEYHIYGSGKDRLVVGFHMPSTATTPETGGTGGTGTKPADVDTAGLHLRKGETVEPVEGHGYAEIVSGARNGMFINTSGNKRHGEAFVLAHKHGVEYHIYGSGSNREVVAMKPRDRDDEAS
jgi:restriction endonuclease Mrr